MQAAWQYAGAASSVALTRPRSAATDALPPAKRHRVEMHAEATGGGIDWLLSPSSSHLSAAAASSRASAREVIDLRGDDDDDDEDDADDADAGQEISLHTHASNEVRMYASVLMMPSQL
jgi:hypothetical protein